LASAKDLKVEVLDDTEDHITEAALKEGAASLLPVRSVLVVVRGMILARAFPVVLTGTPMAMNQDLKGLMPANRLSAGYLALFLRGNADQSLRRLEDAAHETKALRMDVWASLEIAVPTFQEQQRIALIRATMFQTMAFRSFTEGTSPKG